MPDTPASWNQGDHDLLIELKTIMGAVREDIHNLKNIVQSSTLDHETRIRALEQQRWMIVGGAGVVATLVSILIPFVK
jgi:hypothetical protein